MNTGFRYQKEFYGILEFWMCKILKLKQLLYLTDAFPHLFWVDV